MSSRNVLKLDEARALTPAVTDVAGCVMRLQGAVFDSISEADIRNIMAKQKEKAIAGDAKAAAFVLNFVASPKVSYARRDTTVTTRNERRDDDDERTIDATPASAAVQTFVRKQAAKALAVKAPQSIEDLAEDLDIDVADLDPLLDATWFSRNARGEVHLTATGRRELVK